MLSGMALCIKRAMGALNIELALNEELLYCTIIR